MAKMQVMNEKMEIVKIEIDKKYFDKFGNISKQGIEYINKRGYMYLPKFVI